MLTVVSGRKQVTAGPGPSFPPGRPVLAVPHDQRDPIAAGPVEGVRRLGRHLRDAVAEVPEPLG